MNFTLNVVISLSAETVEVAKLLIGNQMPVGINASTPVNLSSEAPSVANGKAARVNKVKADEAKSEDKEEPKDEENQNSDLSVNEGGDIQKIYGLEDVRKIASEKARAGKKDEVKKITSDFGAANIAQLPASKYAEFVKRVEAL